MDVAIRSVERHELQGLLALYGHLCASGAPLPDKASVEWDAIIGDPKLHCLAAVVGEALVGSCILVVVPNLTRGARPYGLIENAITHPSRQ